MAAGQANSTLKLTRAQQDRLKAGECPAIVGEGSCPVEPGHAQEVRKGLTIIVHRVDGRRGGGWSLHYELRDTRDPVRMLRRTPPVVVPEGPESAPTAEALARAAQESSYTSAARGAITDAGEAVDEKTQKRITREARERFRADLEAERERRKQLSVTEQLERVLEDAKARGADVSGDLRVIRKRIESMQRKADAA